MLKLKNKKSLAFKIFLAVVISVFVLFVLMIFASSADDDAVSTQTTSSVSSATVISTTTSTTKKKETVSVNAADIVKEFEKNPKAADKKYKNKILKISGCKVMDFDNSSVTIGYFSDELFVFSFGEIKCYYNKNQAKKADSLKTGDEIKISGEYNGLTSSDKIKLINTKFL